MVKDQLRENRSNYQVASVHFTVASEEETARQSHLKVFFENLYQEDRTPKPHGVLDRRLGTCSKSSAEVKADCLTCGKGIVDCVGHFGSIDLEIPVFHCGYFGAILNILQCICKECSSLLLKPEDKERFRKIATNPNASYTSKKSIKKKIITICKKMHICYNCGSPNGVVKKCGMFKICHDKYRYAKNGEMVKEFMRDFESSTKGKYSQLDPTVDVLDPAVVKDLFSKIAKADIPLLMVGVDKNFVGPDNLILRNIPVAPVNIRPSVVSEIKSGTTEDDLTVRMTEILYINDVIRKHRANGGKVEQYVENGDVIQMLCALLINSELTGGLPSQAGKKKKGRGLIQRLKGKQGRFRGNLSGKRVDFSGRSVISPDPNLLIQQVGVPQHMAINLTYPERVTPHNIKWLRTLVQNGPHVHPGANYIDSKDGFRKYLLYGSRSKHAQELKYGDIVERHMCDGDVVLFNRQPSLHRLSIMCHRAKIVKEKTLRFNECVCAPYNADFDGDEMNIHLPQTEEAKAEALTLMANEVNLVTPRNGELIISATQDFLTGAFLLTQKDLFFTRPEACRITGWAGANQNEFIELPPPAILKPMQLWSGKQLISLVFRPNKYSKIKLNLRTKAKMYSKESEEMITNDSFVVIHNSELMAGVLDKNTLGSGTKENVFYALLKDWGKDAACIAMYRLARITSNFLMNRGFSLGIGDVTPSKRLLEEKQRLVDDGFLKCKELLAKESEGSKSAEGQLVNNLSQIREDAGKICLQELPKTNAALNMSVCGSKGSNINISQMIACVGQQAVNGQRIPDGFDMRSLPHFKLHDRGPGAKGFVANSFYSGLKPTEFFFHAMGGREGLVDTAVKTAETGYMQRRLVKALEDLWCHYDMTVRNSEGHVIQMHYGMDGLDPMFMEGDNKPVNFHRVYLNALSHIPSRQTCMTKGEKETCLNLLAQEFKFQSGGTTLFSSEFEADMKDFVMSKPFRPTQLKRFIEACWEKFHKSRIEPGTAVGALAAQSIGEPGTQMTLKTFHFAGVASMNITQGVPRIKEIINAAKAISTPVIKARLVKEDPQEAIKIKNALQRTTLKEVCDKILQVSTNDMYRIIICLSPKKLKRRQITPESIRKALLLGLKIKDVSRISVLKNRIVLEPWSTGKSINHYFVIQEALKILPNIPISGVRGINKVIVSEENGIYRVEAGGDNFRGVLGTRGVDGTKTTTNNIYQIEQVLGIEAARSSIINEIQFTLGHHGMSVDIRHLTLTADLMTSRGEVLGITRHGLAKMKESVLMLASFEKTADHLFEAAYHGQKDQITGISESIIMGLPCALGSGCMTMLEKTEKHKPLVERPLLFEHFASEYPNNF